MDSRQKAGLDFGSHYENLCALSSVYPLPCVKALLHRNMLDINCDRIRTNDWIPILNTLKINRNLEHIAIRSNYDEAQDNSGKNVSLNHKLPAIRSKEITYKICRSLRDCLIINSQLQHLCLDGIFIRSRDMEIISKGLFENSNLRSLSFEKTFIGDELFEILFPSIKNLMSLVSLNFTSCQLTCKSAETLALLIKHQYTARHNEAWHDSLRYNKPDLDRMGGLRRITINNNPMIGDEGSRVLADCLRDDLWIKALDMHDCGLTKQGGEYMLDMLKFNSTLVVLDIRDNHLIDAETISSIMNQLIINIRGQETEFKWLKVSGHQDKTPKKRKNARMSFGSNKRTLLHRSLLNSSGRKRPKTKEGIVRSNVFGLPWRTALRAEIHRSGTPEKPPVYESLSDASSSMTPLKKKVQKLSESESTKDLEIRRDHMDKSELILKLNEETRLRMAAENKILLLSQANEKLAEEMEELRQRADMLENEDVLENIEQSFQQFHQFLDTLKNMGLGNLVQMAGFENMSTSKLQNPLDITSNNISQHHSFNNYKSKSMNKNINQIKRTNDDATFEDKNASQLDITKNQSKTNSFDETGNSGDDTPVAEHSYDISQSESFLKIGGNSSLWVKNMDASGIYRNASVLDAFNRSKKNRDKNSSYTNQSDKNLKDLSYLNDSHMLNKHSSKGTPTYLRGFDNANKIMRTDTSGYLRESTNINTSLYSQELKAKAVSGSKITDQMRSFDRDDYNEKASEITEDYVAKYLRRVEGLRSENIAPSGGDISSSFDSGDMRRPRSKFDELYERIKNKSIVNK